MTLGRYLLSNDLIPTHVFASPAVRSSRDSELTGEALRTDLSALKILANARFFFESVYGFVYMFERLSKERSDEPLVALLKTLFKEYRHLKVPRVKISKDHFAKLVWAEATNNTEALKELTGGQNFLYEFAADSTGLITFQGEEYDPHFYFREYTELLNKLNRGLSGALSS